MEPVFDDISTETNIHSLPDSVLLSILSSTGSFVSIRQTLPCVCKRWHDLLRGPECPLWNTVHVRPQHEGIDRIPSLNKRSTEQAASSNVVLGTSPGSSPFGNSPYGTSPGALGSSPSFKAWPLTAHNKPTLPTLRSSRVLNWVTKYAQHCQELVLDLSRQNHDFSARTVQQLLSLVKHTLQTLHLLEGPSSGSLDGYEVLSTLKSLEELHISGIPADFLHITMPYLCMLPGLRLLHFKPDMSSSTPAKIAQLPDSLQQLQLTKLWLEQLPAPYNKVGLGSAYIPPPAINTTVTTPPSNAVRMPVDNRVIYQQQNHGSSTSAPMTSSVTSLLGETHRAETTSQNNPSHPATQQETASSTLQSPRNALYQQQYHNPLVFRDFRATQSASGAVTSSSTVNPSPLLSPRPRVSMSRQGSSPLNSPSYSLRSVHLIDCQVTAQVLICLITSPLTELKLLRCSLISEGVSSATCIGALHLPVPCSLKTLVMQSCGIWELSEHMIQQLPELTTLDVSNNEGLGQTPDGITSQVSCLEHLTRLDFSCCGLVSVPPAVSGVTGLRALSLEGNALTTIPMLASEPSLEVVNISRNRLSSLPACVLSMSQLRELTVSAGPLAGTVKLHQLHVQLPKLQRLQVAGASYDSKAVRNLLMLSQNVERSKSGLIKCGVYADVITSSESKAMSASRDHGAQHAQQVQAVDLSDPSLDFLSPSFDPEKALNTQGLQPPDPDAQPLDYVAKCRVLLPPELDESLAGQQLGVGLRTGSQATREKHEQLKEKALRIEQRIRDSCNVTLQGVMDYVEGSSPVAVLKKWQAAGATVKVHTRHAAGVRGCAQGRLIAYDMFMNVILRDVVEHYTVLVKVRKPKPNITAAAVAAAPTTAGAAALPSTSIATHTNNAASTQGPGTVSTTTTSGTEPSWRWARRQEHRQRNLAQVLIKGDSIVSICCADHHEDNLPQQPGHQPQIALGFAAVSFVTRVDIAI